MAITAGDVVWNITGDTSELKKAVKESIKDVSDLKDSFLKNSTAIGASMVGMGAAIGTPLILATKNAVDFNKAMAEVNTLGVQNLGALGDAVKDVASTYGTDLIDSAKAAYQAISAGASEAETPKLLAEAAKAAAAGVSDLTTSIELGTSVSNAFGLSMGDVTGVFDSAFIAVKQGVTTFGELASSVGKVSPLFAAAGLSADEMFASVAALTKGGINTAESVTGIKAALSNIIKPASESAEVAEALGIQFDSQALKAMGLSGFLEMVAEKTGGNIDAMSKLFPSVEALNVVLALTGEQANSFASIMGEMQEKSGTTAEAFEKIKENNPALAFQIASEQLKVLSVDIGNELIPILNEVLPVFSDMIKGIKDFADANPAVFSGIVMISGGFAGLSVVLGSLLMLLSPFIKLWHFGGVLLSKIPGILGVVSAAFGVVKNIIIGVTGAISAPFVAAFAAAVAAVAAAGVAISSEWENIKKLFWDFVGWVADWGKQILNSVLDLGVALGQAFIQMFTDPIGAIQTAWDGLKQYFMSWFNWLSDSVSSAASILYNLIPNLNVGPQAIMDFVGGMIPGFAAGGTVQSGGFIRVGETGPEIIAVPPQTKVMPGKGGAGVGSGVNVNITVSNPTFMDDAMMNRFNVGIGRIIGEQLRTTGAVA